MPDANTIRQRRYDNCVRLCACPRCDAPAGEACRSKDYVDPEYLQEASMAASVGMGKTWTSTRVITHQMMKLAYRKQHIGGLHQERWQALNDLDAVTRLAEIIE